MQNKKINYNRYQQYCCIWYYKYLYYIHYSQKNKILFLIFFLYFLIWTFLILVSLKKNLRAPS